MTDSWTTINVDDLQVGAEVRYVGHEFTVTRIDTNFLGRDNMICLIEDTPERWHAYPRGRRPDRGEGVTFEIDLSGRRAVVTGGGQGVGRGIAKALGAAGAEVFVNDLVEERAAGSGRRDRGRRRHRRHRGVRRHRLLRGAGEFAELGLVDILVNNAGNAGKADSMGFEEMKYFHEEDPARGTTSCGSTSSG